jgi:hypothetical protein
VPKHLATWNTARDAWEKPDTEGLTCGHSAVYSATFPTSGSMRNGVVYELPKWEHAMPDTASSSSPDDAKLLLTPVASEGLKPSNTMGVARRLSTGQVFLTNQIVTLCNLDPSESPQPTVPAMNADGPRLLPTPAAADSTGGRISKEKGGFRESGAKRSITLATALHHDLKQIGETTPQQSTAGNEPSAGQLPGQLSLLDELEQSA